jgi:hypothetical protein
MNDFFFAVVEVWGFANLCFIIVYWHFLRTTPENKRRSEPYPH